MMRIRTITLMLSFGVILFGCKKNDAANPIDTTNDGSFKVFTEGKITTVQNLMADTIIGLSPIGQPYGSNKYSFFSIENGTLISPADSATTKWDLAFRGTTILVNNGTSGPGNGGAFVQIGTFDNILSVSPDSSLKVDAAPVYSIPTGSGKGWYNYDGANNLITPLPGRIIMVRTASGKFAKLEITNYYKKGVTPGSSVSDAIKLSSQRYYAFRYTFQANGSTTF